MPLLLQKALQFPHMATIFPRPAVVSGRTRCSGWTEGAYVLVPATGRLPRLLDRQGSRLLCSVYLAQVGSSWTSDKDALWLGG